MIEKPKYIIILIFFLILCINCNRDGDFIKINNTKQISQINDWATYGYIDSTNVQLKAHRLNDISSTLDTLNEIKHEPVEMEMYLPFNSDTLIIVDFLGLESKYYISALKVCKEMNSKWRLEKDCHMFVRFANYPEKRIKAIYELK